MNVMVTISPGSFTSPSKREKPARQQIVVLPDPLGARTRMDRVASSARSRCDWSGGVVFCLSGIGFLLCVGVRVFNLRRIFLDAAQRLQAAMFAGLRVFAWIDFGAAGDEIARHLFDVRAPSAHLVVRQRLFHNCFACVETADQRGPRVLHASQTSLLPARICAKTRPPALSGPSSSVIPRRAATAHRRGEGGPMSSARPCPICSR